jgi:predicted P-loop ATPase
MITKEEVLSRTTEEEIIRFHVPDFNSKGNKNYHSLFAENDKNPSLHFYQQNGNWMFKSHNTGHQGDVFQFVADIYKLDCKHNFIEVLHKINDDLTLGLNGHALLSKNIKIETLHYTNLFLKYWKQYGVKEEILFKYKVQQVAKHEFINSKGKKCNFDYQRLNQIVAVYNINGRVKIYIPEIGEDFTQEISFKGQKKAFGFKDQTSSDIFGLAQLPNEVLDFLIITAGEKDCLVANAHGFPAISLQSENQLPQSDLLENLKSKATKILCCYDNDTAGKKASEKLKNSFGIQPIVLPSEIKDTADYFKKFTADDFRKLVQNAIQQTEITAKQKSLETSTGKTIFHQAEEWLSAYYNFRYNVIKHEIEVSLIGKNEFKAINENSLFIELNKNGIKISLPNLIAILKSDFVEHYNPFHYYFTNLKDWKKGDRDYISELASYVKSVEQEQFSHHFKKWIVRSVACALEHDYYNKQAFILVHSAQNSGKSTFCRFLCPPALKEYIAEDVSDDKDSRILLTKNFLINLDELSSLARKEINSLKSLFSKDKINERLPYDRKNSILSRVCSFIGSTNMAEFLTDETGSVRWLCFTIKTIDWNYSKSINIDDVWSQAYSLYSSEKFNYNMTSEEIQDNERRNASFQVLSTEAEIIPNFLDLPTESNPGEFMTATDVLMYISPWISGSIRINKVMLGKGLVQNGFKKIKDSKTQRYGFYAVKLK